MAPINSLQRREADLSFSMSSSLKGAIAAAVVIIVLFIVGVGVFIFYYNKSSRKGPLLAHVGTKANYVSSSEASVESTLSNPFSEKIIETSSGESSSEEISVVTTPTPEPAAVVTRVPSRVPEEEEEGAVAAAAAAAATTTTTATQQGEENAAGMKPLRKPFSSPKLLQLQQDESKRSSDASVDEPPMPGKDFV